MARNKRKAPSTVPRRQDNLHALIATPDAQSGAVPLVSTLDPSSSTSTPYKGVCPNIVGLVTDPPVAIRSKPHKAVLVEDVEEEQLDFTFSEDEGDVSPNPSPPPSATHMSPVHTPGGDLYPSNSILESTPPPLYDGKWRDLFSYNRNSNACTKLSNFSLFHTTKSCSISSEDFHHNFDVWKQCAVGYISGKYLGFKALNNLISTVWKCEATFSTYESGWLVYRFNSEEDKLAVLQGGPYLVYGRPLILRPMTQFFDFSSEEITKVPI
jgi:hypothetical protein